MSSTCDICGRTFAKPFNLRRHEREVHGHISNDHNFLISTYAVLEHPFTCIVAGCTQSGKTVWVKILLENAQKTISPPPPRIIWCYGQWQPSYFDMMKTMSGIEFNQGIPEDIDEPDYLDVSQRNLIVLDDLMAEYGKDKRIADLFTKGSHHRNLSVIYIVQNVFHQGKEMRNISLNAHYIVLFKSPRDRQQISILARQVNPGRVQEFMKSYEKATSPAHGYLMLDLKPTTDDEERLKTNILPGETSTLEQYVRKKSYRHSPNLNAMYNTEKRLTKLAKEEHKMPESQSDDESDSSVVESDDSDDEKESVNERIQSDSDEEMESNSKKLTCHHCEKDHAHIVYLLTCPRCSWRDFYWDKDDHCTICDEASTLDFSRVIGFCDSCASGVSYSKSGTTIFTPNKETYRE